MGITYHIWKGEGGGGVRKAPKTQNVTGYQKFRSRHPLEQQSLLVMALDLTQRHNQGHNNENTIKMTMTNAATKPMTTMKTSMMMKAVGQRGYI